MRKLLLAAVLILAACQEATPWRNIEPPDGSFTAKMPGVRLFERKGPTTVTWTGMAGHTQCMIQEFRDPQYTAAKAEETLRHYGDPRSADIDGKLVESGVVQSGPYTGKSVRIEGVVTAARTPVVYLSRVFVADGRLYILSANGKPGELNTAIADEFFQSFQLKK